MNWNFMKSHGRLAQIPLTITVTILFVLSLNFLQVVAKTGTEDPVKSANIYWEISTPEEQGIESEPLVAMLEKIYNESLKIRSVIIIRNNKLVLETYVHPYNRNVMHDVKSVSKSIISAVVGISLDRRIFKNLDQKVSEFFPEYFPEGEDPRKREINLRDLLMMSAGLDLDENGQVMREIMAQNDWIRATFAQPMIADSIRSFNYCTFLTHTMSAILTRASGKSLFELSNNFLFEPLGISRIHWEKGPQGYYFGGDKLWLTPPDMAKFGFLFLNNGKWEKKQIVSDKWVTESTQNQFEIFNKDGFSGYGYWWWLAEDGSYLARGFGGQIISVYPELNMVVVFTGADNNHWRMLTREYILPAVKGDDRLPRNDLTNQRLNEIARELEIPIAQTPQPLPDIARKISGKKYVLHKNDLDFSDITFWFQENDVCRFLINYAEGELDLTIGLDDIYRISENVQWGIKPDNNTLALRGEWIYPNKFSIDFHEVGEPFYFDIEFVFSDGLVESSFIWQPMNWHCALSGKWD
jgi:CubicO group peptidase (beta-lactamase class C family)